MHSSGVVLTLVWGSLLWTGCGPPPWLVERIAARNPGVLFHVDTADSIVALTLDDGPHPELTPLVLDVLAAYDAHATFFLMGDNVPDNEAVVRRIVGEGHELGNHMMTARPSIFLPADTFAVRLRRAHDQLAAFGPVCWFRPASGWFDAEMVRQAQAFGYGTALGSVYPNDAQNPFAAYHARYVLRHVRPGAVIVLHEGTPRRQRVVKVLRRVLPALQRRGYRVVTLFELARRAQPPG